MAIRDVQELPSHLVTLLVDIGPSTLVLVEGDDDKYVFNEWYPEGDHNLFYHVAPGGSPGVVELLNQVLTQTSLRRAFGIIDRDFRSQAEVDQRLSDPDGHLFIWSRYELENYLLLPNAISNVLRVYYGGKAIAPTEAETADKLLVLCQKLCPVMAANWVCLEAGKDHFGEAFPLNDRASLVHVTARKLDCAEGEAEQRIVDKEALLHPQMTFLEQAHSCIKGKHLLYQLHALYVSEQRQVKDGLSIDYLMRQLTNAVKETGLHEDVRTIIEQRILA